MATVKQQEFLNRHNAIIAKLPRGPRKQSSKMQSRFAGALGGLANKGIKLDKPNQALYLSGYADGLRDAMRWPSEARSGKLDPKP